MKQLSIFLVIIISVMISCNRPECVNSNPIFDQFEPLSDKYKKELILQIEKIGRSKISYYISSIKEVNDKDYLVLYVQGNDLCALGYFEVRDKNKLEDVFRTKGLGYKGARVKGFEFSIQEDEKIDLVYKNLASIVD